VRNVGQVIWGGGFELKPLFVDNLFVDNLSFWEVALELLLLRYILRHATVCRIGSVDELESLLPTHSAIAVMTQRNEIP